MQMSSRISCIFLLLCNYHLVHGVPLATVDNDLALQQQQPQQQQHQQLNAINYEGNENRIIGKDTTTAQHNANTASFTQPHHIEYNNNNNNEWRPLGHGDPLKNDPTFDYSPPALERVRYWASSDDNQSDNDGDGHEEESKKKSQQTVGEHGGKISNGDAGGGGLKQLLIDDPTSVYALKNAKNEVPLLQPKFNGAAARRNYGTYAATASGGGNIMPPPMTRLMPPPPMPKSPSSQAAKIYWPQQSQPQPQPQPQPQQTMAMSRVSMATPHHEQQPYDHQHAKYRDYYEHTPHHHQHGGSSQPPSYQHHHQAQVHSYAHHHHPQTEATHHYFSYTRPTHSAPVSYHTKPGGSHHPSTSSTSPNAIHMSQPTQHKTSAATTVASRKPWLHELLQKELVMKPTTMSPPPHSQSPPTISHSTPMKYSGSSSSPSMAAANYHHTGHNAYVTYTTMPSTHYNYNNMKGTSMPMMSHNGGSVYVTPTPSTSMPYTMATTTTTTRPTTTTAAIKTAPITTTTTTTTTAAPRPPPPPPPPPPMQPKPTPSTTTTTTTTTSRLLIPNTSNLQHRPTVVPMEPLMTTDSLFSHYKQPEKPWRGGGAHSHMYLIIEGHSKVKKYGKNEIDYHQPKIVPVIPKREPVVRLARPDETTRGTPESFNVKHLHTKTSTTTTTTTPMPPASSTIATTTKATTTMKTTKTPPSIATTTSTTTTTNKPTPMKDDFNVPPTAMSGLLSFLDNMIRDVESEPTAAAAVAPTTKLQLVLTTTKPAVKPSLALDARISSQAAGIAAEGDGSTGSTELPPREERQVFDYDQLPESRLKQQQLLSQGTLVEPDEYAIYGDEDELADEDVAAEDDNYAGSQQQQLIKRIDKLVDEDDDGLIDDAAADISLPLDDLTDGEDDEDDDDEAEAAAEAEAIEDLNIAIGRSNTNKST